MQKGQFEGGQLFGLVSMSWVGIVFGDIHVGC